METFTTARAMHVNKAVGPRLCCHHRALFVGTLDIAVSGPSARVDDKLKYIVDWLFARCKLHLLGVS